MFEEGEHGIMASVQPDWFRQLAQWVREPLRRLLPARIKQMIKRTRIAKIIPSPPPSTDPYEPGLCGAIERLVKPGWVCADVGANIGIITQLMARLVGSTGRVVAFELHPDNVRSLRENVMASGWGKVVHVDACAVSDGSRDRLWVFPGRWSSSAEWNIVGHDVEGIATDAQFEVPAVSLDQYFVPGARLDLVKIDVEGAEAHVLAGMKRLLRETRPVAVIEFHDEVGWSGRNELYTAGYDLYEMNGKKLDPEKDLRRVYHCLGLPKGVSFPSSEFAETQVDSACQRV